jgi:hypothetical protein
LAELINSITLSTISNKSSGIDPETQENLMLLAEKYGAIVPLSLRRSWYIIC